MIVNILKHTSHRSVPKELVYTDYNVFEQIYLEIMNVHAPMKKKLLRANHVPYMTKALRKAIMKRSGLKSKYLENKISENLKSRKKRRNLFSKLYKKGRKKCERLDLNNVTDNKKFLKTVKPLFDTVITWYQNKRIFT